MKILILGVNGFIGNALTRRILTTRDWEVYGMDLYSNKLAFISWKATSASTRNGSNTTSKSAIWSCPWWPSPPP
jgi:nucleoside-diphosphate-sugar epimerase